MRISNILKLLSAIIISELAGVLGAVFTTSSIQGWYATLARPPLNPPNWIFGPVWTMLYFLIGVSVYLVWKNGFKVRNHLWEKGGKAWNPISERLWRGDLQKQNVIGIIAIQYALNVLWSVVFFGLHLPIFAFLVIVGLWISILYMIINFYRISKTAAWILVPYILWVSFAAYLNLAIALLN